MVLLMLILQFSFIEKAKASGNNEHLHLTIEQDDGVTFENALFMNGSSEIPLQNFNWYLTDAFQPDSEVLDSGKFSSVSSVSEGHWEWTLEINVSTYDCTCRIQFSPDLINHASYNSRIIYLGAMNHSPFIHPFIIDHETSRNYDYLLADSPLSITIPAVIPPTSLDEIIVKLNVCMAPNGFCQERMTDFSEFNYSTSTDGVLLTLMPATVTLSDGFWRFNITILDKFLSSSNVEYFQLLVDENPPQIEVSCDVSQSVSVSESADTTVESSPVIFESENISFSARIEDGYDGGDNILTWTLVHPDGSRRALSNTESISNSMITLSPEIPGQWTVELLVRDTSGRLLQSTHYFEVINKAPIAVVELDSFIITENFSAKVELGGSWELNSSLSFDSTNDQNSLIHMWVIDGKPLANSIQILNSSSFDGVGLYDIRLVVEDDNGELSQIEFQLQIEEMDTENPTSILNSWILYSLIFSLLLGGSVAYYALNGKNQQTSVPKWKKKPLEDREIEHEFDEM